MANDVSNFKKQIRDRRIQMDLNKSLVSLPLARFGFSEVRGATRFHRPAKTRLYATTYTAETALTSQPLGSTDEYLDVDQTRAVPFFIDHTQVLDSAYDLMSMYAPEATYALRNEMDGKFFAQVSNAFYQMGKLDIEGTGANTDGITASTSLMAKIISTGKAKLLQNRVEDTTPFFVVFDPMTMSVWEQTLIAAGFNTADTTLRNGYVTSLPALGTDVYVSNNVKHTITLTSTKNLAADDAIIVNGITAVIKASPSAANEIDLGSDEATTLSNIAAWLNKGPGAGTAYIEPSQDDRAKLSQNLVSAVAWTHTVVITTAGYVSVTESVDSGTAYSFGEHQRHVMMGQKGCVDMVIQKSVASEEQAGTNNGVLGTYVITWTRYGIKTFAEWVQRMIRILIKVV